MISFCSIALSLLSILPSATDTARIHFSGSIESDNQLYVADDAVGYSRQNKAGSNTYVKLDLTSLHIDAGLQAEVYPEPELGFDPKLKGAGVPFYYVRYKNKGLNITAGSFYEQYGSGLLLRSWEDRQLGINNAITGFRLAYSDRESAVSISTMCGKPRYLLNSIGNGKPLLKYAFEPWQDTSLYGLDSSFDITKVLGATDWNLLLEFSLLDKYENNSPPQIGIIADSYGFQIPENVMALSSRIVLQIEPLSVKFEYVEKGQDFHSDKVYRSPVSYSLRTGRAFLIESDFIAGPLSASMSLRRLSNMEQPLSRGEFAGSVSNTINYIPALCQQHSYMLAGLDPYIPCVDGEEGGQLDLYYRIKKGTAIAGKWDARFHVNLSAFWTLPEALSNWTVPRLAWRELTADFEKRWSRHFRTTFFMSIQEKSPTHGDRFSTVAQNVFAVEGLYKTNGSMSIRTELQYLYSRETYKDWMAALCEVNIAPRFSFHISDMYNHGSSGIHYYDTGVTYSHGMYRIEIGYGRHREGLICSGGICRMQPAYTGGRIGFSMVF